MTFEEAKKRLVDCIKEDGWLNNNVWYLSWHAGDDLATLDGDFSADDLIAIATYMKEFKPCQPSS